MADKGETRIDVVSDDTAQATTSDVHDIPAADIPQSRPHRLSVVTAAVSRQVRNIKQATPQYPLVRYVLRKRASSQKPPVSDDVAQPVERILLRPLMALRLLGLRYILNDAKTWINRGYIYCCLVLLAMVVNVGRLCGSYKKSDGIQITAIQIIFHMFNAQSMFTVIIFIFAATPRMARFLGRFDKYREFYGESCVSVPDATRLAQRTFTGICILLLSPVAMDALGYFLLPYVTARAARPFHDAEELYSVTAFFYVIWHLFVSFINTIPVCFLFVVCRMLQQEFAAVNFNLRKTLAGKPDSERLEAARLRHGSLADVVTSFDDVMSPYILLTCVADVPMLAFHASVFTYTDDHLTTNYTLFIVARLISCVCVATHLFTVLIAAVTLANMVITKKAL